MLISWRQFLFSSFYFTPKLLTSQNHSGIFNFSQKVTQRDPKPQPKKMEPQITQITQINKKFLRGG
jgi:hypothetical protein